MGNDINYVRRVTPNVGRIVGTFAWARRSWAGPLLAGAPPLGDAGESSGGICWRLLRCRYLAAVWLMDGGSRGDRVIYHYPVAGEQGPARPWKVWGSSMERVKRRGVFGAAVRHTTTAQRCCVSAGHLAGSDAGGLAVQIWSGTLTPIGKVGFPLVADEPRLLNES